MKGVYIIHDAMSGKRYVGSAYGDTGLWARWEQYATTLHGGNIDLRALVEREGDDYARDNLMFALFEFWAMRTSDEFVLKREAYWKSVLLSRQFGHNRKLAGGPRRTSDWRNPWRAPPSETTKAPLSTGLSEVPPRGFEPRFPP